LSLTITSWTLDAASYNTGTPVNLTVSFTSTDVLTAGEVSDIITVALTDAADSVTQSSDGTTNFPDLVVNSPSDQPQPVTGTTTDSGGHTWVPGAVTFAAGTTPPFSGTALFSTTA
jgi:hypothetical protein